MLSVLLISGLVIPRIFGAESYGRYATALAVIAIVQAASTLGLTQVGTCYLAPLWRSDPTRALSLASSIWTAQLAISLCAGAAAMLWLWLSPETGLRQAAAAVGILTVSRLALEATRNHFFFLGRTGRFVGVELFRLVLSLAVSVLFFSAFGLSAAFAALAGLHALLFLATGVCLSRVVALRPRFSWSTLRPFRLFSSAAYVGTISSVAATQAGVLAIAKLGRPAEAGFLGLSILLHSVLMSLLQPAFRSLLPMLAELGQAQPERLRRWGGLIMRYAAAGGAIVTVSWCLLGQTLIEHSVGSAFLPVHASGAVMLLATVFYGCAFVCNGLIFARGSAPLASANLVLSATVTIGGLVWALQGGDSAEAYRVCWAYVASAALFWVSSYASLALFSGIWLDVKATLVLISPAILMLPTVFWEASLPVRAAALVTVLLGYGVLSVVLKLLPLNEIQSIARNLRPRGNR